MKKKVGLLLCFAMVMLIPFSGFGTSKVCFTPLTFEKDSTKTKVIPLNNVAPYLDATGNQMFCPGSTIKIVTDMQITDPDDTGIDAIYIQISSGYALGDLLSLTGSHPTIASSWNATTAILSLTGVGGQPTYIDLIAAIKDVEFSTTTSNPSGIRNFSISVGQANYLPSNGHYYLFIPSIGITWSDAKVAAQISTYYGLQGYLATLTSAEESQLAGEQTTGAGWIGGSDEAVEGTWRWMTGPEVGTVFWTGNFTGFTTTYAFWNSGEPNNLGNENYAHVTAPGVGITGSWNDLTNIGEPSGNYQPKGYIVEYGGMPGDPILHIATSTTITIASITSTVTATRCGTGTEILQATSNTGNINWYDSPTSTTVLGTGTSFTTPTIAATTPYYAAAHTLGCPDISRTLINAFVIPKPILTVTSPYYMCDETYTVIDVQTTSGIMFWFDSPTSQNTIFLGTHFVVPNIHQDTVFYAEANLNNCLSDRAAVDIKVYNSPVATDETLDLCKNDTILLDAGNPSMSYLWSTGATTQTIQSDGLTQYTVTITTPPPANCSKTKNFTIQYHNAPEIASITTDNSVVTINMVTAGDFLYSINGQDFQTSNVFTVTVGGLYTCTVKEKNNCGIKTQKFIVLVAPEFFTPNNDGYNDTWFIKGLINYPGAQVKIFDRFGKFIIELNPSTLSWDGTLNGKELPSSDYWYVATINDSTPEKRGHFSLKR